MQITPCCFTLFPSELPVAPTAELAGEGQSGDLELQTQGGQGAPSLNAPRRDGIDPQAHLSAGLQRLAVIEQLELLQIKERLVELVLLKTRSSLKLEPSSVVPMRGSTEILIKESDETIELVFWRYKENIGQLLDAIGRKLQSSYKKCVLSVTAEWLNAIPKNLAQSFADHLGERIVALNFLPPPTVDHRAQHTMTSQRHLVAIAKSLPGLLRLSFANCSKITASNIQEVASGCSGLYELDLSGCTALNDEAIGRLLVHAKAISFAGCSQISPLGFCDFLKRHPNLESFNLSECQVAEVVMQALAAHARLHSLALARCALTDEHLHILQNAKCLYEEIDLRGCKLVTRNTIDTFARRHFFAQSNGVNSSKRTQQLISCYLQLYLQAILQQPFDLQIDDQRCTIGIAQARFVKANGAAILPPEVKTLFSDRELSLDIALDALSAQQGSIIHQFLTELQPYATVVRVLPGSSLTNGWLFERAQQLSLSGCPISDEDFLKIECPKLTCLNLFGCKKLTSKTFSSLSPNLRTLQIEACPNLTAKSILELFSKCKMLGAFLFDIPQEEEIAALNQDEKVLLLRALKLQNPQKSEEAIAKLCQTLVIDVRWVLPLLQLASDGKIDPLFAEVSHWVQISFQQLLRLEMQMGRICVHLYDFVAMCKEARALLLFTQLKSELAKAKNIHLVVYKADALLPKMCSELFLDLKGITRLDWMQEKTQSLAEDHFLRYLGSMGDLRELELSNCHLPNTYLPIVSCKTPNLELLVLHRCQNVSRLDLELSAAAWTKLCQLHLIQCNEMREDDLLFLARRYRLRALSLVGNRQVGDSLLARLPKELPELEQLDLAATTITDKGLRQLFCPNLKLQTLKVDDTSVSLDFAAKPPLPVALKQLSIDGCRNVTPEAVALLANYFPVLQTISLKRCPNIDEHALLALTDALATLRSIDARDCAKVHPILAQYLLNSEPKRRSLDLDRRHNLTDVARQLILRLTGTTS